ncbi:MAG: TrkH family potassium uptake protein, partial [Clostridia bacterium]|nr:TrkH family potassium uptake protein [Clostridia bacterium]
FETVSGLTTTGASILTNVEALSHGSLLWRSFTHWIGGMGVLVLMVAIIPADNDRTMHIMRAEMPGPVVDKIVPRMRDTAKILYLIYIGLTALQIVFLLCGGLSFYESLICAFGTAGTGGFFIRSDSLASLSPYVQWVIAAFLVLFGINFNVFFLILARRFRQALRSEETWLYLGIFAVSTAVIAINISGLYQTVEETMRHSAFQVISMMSTAGFATTNFDLWPQLAKNVMFVLMFIGGCAGSTAGGLKVSRILILFKVICRELKTILRPRTAAVLKIDGKRVPDSTANGITSYLALYFVIFLSAFLLISFEPFDFLTNISAVNTCFNNVGPGFSVIGPMGSFAGYTVFSKIVLALTMLLGRLEIYPIILTVYSLTRRHSK